MVFTLNRPDQCFEYPAFLTLQQKSLLIVCLLEMYQKNSFVHSNSELNYSFLNLQFMEILK